MRFATLFGGRTCAVSKSALLALHALGYLIEEGFHGFLRAALRHNKAIEEHAQEAERRCVPPLDKELHAHLRRDAHAQRAVKVGQPTRSGVPGERDLFHERAQAL